MSPITIFFIALSAGVLILWLGSGITELLETMGHRVNVVHEFRTEGAHGGAGR